MHVEHESLREARTDHSTAARGAGGHTPRSGQGRTRSTDAKGIVTRLCDRTTGRTVAPPLAGEGKSRASPHQHDSANQTCHAGRQREKKHDQKHVRPLVPPLANLIDNEPRVQRCRNERKNRLKHRSAFLYISRTDHPHDTARQRSRHTRTQTSAHTQCDTPHQTRTSTRVDTSVLRVLH